MTFFFVFAVLPLVLMHVFAAPLLRWMQKTTARLWALVRRGETYIEEHGEHTMSWPQKFCWVREQWREICC